LQALEALSCCCHQAGLGLAASAVPVGEVVAVEAVACSHERLLVIDGNHVAFVVWRFGQWWWGVVEGWRSVDIKKNNVTVFACPALLLPQYDKAIGEWTG
jgi:hypothetical protein